MSAGLIVSERSVPALPRHVKLRFDQARGRWIVNAPERVLVPDAIALAILERCDGQRDVAAIADDLSARYSAPRAEILADVIEMLQDLADKGFLTLRSAA